MRLRNLRLKGKRKFAAAMLIITLSFVGLMFDRVTGEQWVSLMPWIIGLFAAGNVGEHITEAADNVENETGRL